MKLFNVSLPKMLIKDKTRVIEKKNRYIYTHLYIGN